MWKLFCLVVVAPMSFILTDVMMPYHPPLTFEQRWEAVPQSNVGVKKGDRLDRKVAPAPKPQQRQPTMVPMRIRVAGGCISFCDYP
jgi:hypothetical protein